MTIWKLARLLPWPIAVVLLAFWSSAEEDRLALEEQLEDERDRRLVSHRLYLAAHDREQRMVDRLGLAAAMPDILDAAQWAEVRAHAEALDAGAEYGPPPHIVERVEMPPSWPRLQAAIKQVVASKGRFAPSGFHADLTELEAALTALGEVQPATRREGSNRPAASPMAHSVEPHDHPDAIGMDCAEILTIADRLPQEKRQELLSVARAIRDGKPGPTRRAALERLVERCRAMRRGAESGDPTRSISQIAPVCDALAEFDALLIAGPDEVPDPPTPLAPIGWTELTDHQRSGAQAYVDVLRGVVKSTWSCAAPGERATMHADHHPAIDDEMGGGAE